jgi:AbrB family looped-hinge helix DNA binding protein
MYTSKVSEKGWIVIPKQLRLKYGLKKGSQLQIVDYGDVLTLVPLPDDPVETLQGLLKDGPSLTAELLAERALERTQEEVGRHAQNLGLG